ncbi:MAG: hypothetical protein WDZ83_00305 [Rhizobiaceae bacterium]
MRRAFLTRASELLDEANLGQDDRERLYRHALTLANASSELQAGSQEEQRLDTVRDTLSGTAAKARQSDWYTIIVKNWPAPIAHEIDRLLELLETREPNVATADTALFQYRDSFEVLIKFIAIIMLRAVAAYGRDGNDAEWVTTQLFRKLSSGSWIGNLREAVQRIQARPDQYPAEVRALAEAARPDENPTDGLLAGAGVFAEVRNDVIGHGARALDVLETANLVAGLVETGNLQSVRGASRRVMPFFGLLEAMVVRHAFEGMEFIVRLPEGEERLQGPDATRRWLARREDEADPHEEEWLATALRLADNSLLALSPLITARRCIRCQRRDVILYDALYNDKAGGVFDALDYARGHKSRYGAHQATDLAAFFENEIKRGATVEPAVPEGLPANDQSVIEALDRARLDQNYHSPQFIRKELAAFLESRIRGVFWLQAPAHVGKTTFVLGLSSDDIEEEPITPRFAHSNHRQIYTYFVRREIRSGVAGFVNTLDRQFTTKLTNDNNRDQKPTSRALIADPTPEAFVEWLAAWRAFAVRFGMLGEHDPLLLAIDGLDEAEPPAADAERQASPILLLPSEEQLPEHIYLVLTSRLPHGDDEVPDFLARRIVPLYADKSATT